MIWKITCYNGAIWESKTCCTSLTDTLKRFKKETGYHEIDIKYVENLH